MRQPKDFNQKNYVHISKKYEIWTSQFLGQSHSVVAQSTRVPKRPPAKHFEVPKQYQKFQIIIRKLTIILCPQKVVPSQMFLNRTLKVVILFEGRDHSFLYLEVYCSAALSTVTYNFHLDSMPSRPTRVCIKKSPWHLYGCQR